MDRGLPLLVLEVLLPSQDAPLAVADGRRPRLPGDLLPRRPQDDGAGRARGQGPVEHALLLLELDDHGVARLREGERDRRPGLDVELFRAAGLEELAARQRRVGGVDRRLVEVARELAVVEALVREALPSASIVDFFSQGFDLLWAQPAVADVRDGGGGLQRFEVAVVQSAVLVVVAVWPLAAERCRFR